MSVEKYFCSGPTPESCFPSGRLENVFSLEIGGIKGEDMGLQFLRHQWCCFFLLLFFLISCSLNLELTKPKGEEEFFQETSHLEKRTREDRAFSVRAKSHLRLAFLYVHSRNPQLNYSRALQEMESYLSMSPEKAQKDDIQNWLAVLRQIDLLNKYKIEMEKKNQSLQAQNEKLQWSLEKAKKANIDLREEVAGLKEKNNKMIETIERLKILDSQMEEKRTLIK